MMDIDYNSFHDLTEHVSLGTSGYNYILNREGELVVHPLQQLIYHGLAQEDLTAVNQFLVGQGRDRVDGRERVLISATLNQTRWRLVGVAYIDEILELQNTFIRIVSIVLLCAAMLSFAVASVMAYWVTRPMRYLEDTMRQVEAGDLNVAIKEQGFREARSVSVAFNHMIARIRALMDQIVQEQEKSASMNSMRFRPRLTRIFCTTPWTLSFGWKNAAAAGRPLPWFPHWHGCSVFPLARDAALSPSGKSWSMCATT